MKETNYEKLFIAALLIVFCFAFSDDEIKELSGTDSNGNPVDNMLRLDYDNGVKLERQQEFKYTLEDGVLTLIP